MRVFPLQANASASMPLRAGHALHAGRGRVATGRAVDGTSCHAYHAPASRRAPSGPHPIQRTARGNLRVGSICGGLIRNERRPRYRSGHTAYKRSRSRKLRCRDAGRRVRVCCGSTRGLNRAIDALVTRAPSPAPPRGMVGIGARTEKRHLRVREPTETELGPWKGARRDGGVPRSGHTGAGNRDTSRDCGHCSKTAVEKLHRPHP